jgi:hypothetical protein
MMSLTRDDAAEALRLVDEAGARSTTLRRYENIAPHLIMWGGIYAVAYTTEFLLPQYGGLPWVVLGPAGGVGGYLIAQRYGGKAGSGFFPMAILAIVAFIVASVAVMAPQDPRQLAAFVPLVVALIYVLWGLAIGRRLMFTGIALGVLTVFGFFVLPGIFLLWMAAVAGGALVLGGIWLRQA